MKERKECGDINNYKVDLLPTLVTVTLKCMFAEHTKRKVQLKCAV